MDYPHSLITVVELPEFIRRSRKLISEEERERLISYLAVHPLSGVVMEGTGGIRKLRWKREGVGKSGGVRVVYYYHNPHHPLFLLTIFGKSEKANLTRAERNELGKLVGLLVESKGGAS